jgi:hypothetical protein
MGCVSIPRASTYAQDAAPGDIAAPAPTQGPGQPRNLIWRIEPRYDSADPLYGLKVMMFYCGGWLLAPHLVVAVMIVLSRLDMRPRYEPHSTQPHDDRGPSGICNASFANLGYVKLGKDMNYSRQRGRRWRFRNVRPLVASS